MTVKDIEKMNFEELRETVKDLSEQLKRFKRLFEDEVYNIDNAKLAASVRKEKDAMRSALTVAAGKISSVVEEVGKQNSKIEQTASHIQAVVSKKANLEKAVAITSLDLLKTADPNKVYVYHTKDENGKAKSEYYYWDGNAWTLLDGNNIYTVFEQTADGFNLKGNVRIDGETVVTENLKLSGNVTWDMSNSPVKTQYSAEGTTWHDTFEEGDQWMQMSFDGGANWTEPPTKVVGTDGKNGTNGTNATVTPKAVFDALTDDGAQQGIFAAFSTDANKTRIYINSEYLATKIAEVEDILYIGDVDTIGEEKMIKFNSSASISTFETSGGHHAGLEVSAEQFRFKGSAVDFSGTRVYGLDDIEAVAVFG